MKARFRRKFDKSLRQATETIDSYLDDLYPGDSYYYNSGTIQPSLSQSYAPQPYGYAPPGYTPPYAPPSLPLRINDDPYRPWTEQGDGQPNLSASNTTGQSSLAIRRGHYSDTRIVRPQPPRDRAGRLAPWFIEHPEVDGNNASIHGLCHNCRHINFKYLFLQTRELEKAHADPEDYIRLGRMADIEKQTSCPFCALVAYTVKATLERDAEGHVITTTKTNKLLCANWYLTPFVYFHEGYGPGFQLLLLPNIRENDGDVESAADAAQLRPDWPYAVRLFHRFSQGGRRVPKHQLDFEWIKATFELCDLSTEMPARNFRHSLRVIDVSEMCIDDLPEECDYVALSYCWGKVEMLTLSMQNHDALRSPSSLISCPNVPQTIRDAIVLVRNVGLRYLWVDSLCVIQDDEQDMAKQLQQMGEVYRHSYFTIFAISGTDVNHGLPGVRWDSRKLTQITRQIGDLTIANCLPWMEEEELVQTGAWGTRAWTYQERFLAQRGLFIGDRGMTINCLHTYGPEDQHCMHELQKSTHLIAKGSTIFYSGLNKLCTPYIDNGKSTAFDMYVILISEYSQRQLTFQSDAARAGSAVFSYLINNKCGKLIYGIPEKEFDAALLWSPIGSSIRRIDQKTGKPLFPSWSWLGWQGHAAWPWQVDRDTYCTTRNTPIVWLNALCKRPANQPSWNPPREAWLTPEELCLPPSPHRNAVLAALEKKFPDRLHLRELCDSARRIHPEWLSKYKIDWPNGIAPQFQHNDPPSHKITLRAICGLFYVVGKPFRRAKPYNVQYPIQRLSVVDEDGRLVGYIDIPDPASTKIQLGRRLFVALSRSTINNAVTPGPVELISNPVSRKQFPRPRIPQSRDPFRDPSQIETQHDAENFRHSTRVGNVDASGHFDTEILPTDRPWCMFNVMMLREVAPALWPREEVTASNTLLRSMDHPGGVTFERVAIGRIHIDAFDHDGARSMRTIELV